MLEESGPWGPSLKTCSYWLFTQGFLFSRTIKAGLIKDHNEVCNGAIREIVASVEYDN